MQSRSVPAVATVLLLLSFIVVIFRHNPSYANFIHLINVQQREALCNVKYTRNDLIAGAASPNPLPPSLPSSARQCCVRGPSGKMCFQPPASGPVRLVFYSNYLGLRGTAVALYDYAVGWEVNVCGEAWILAPKEADMSAVGKFNERFPGRVVTYESDSDMNVRVADIAPLAVYGIVHGTPASAPHITVAKLLMHAVFNAESANLGDTIAVVSDTVPRMPNVPVVPHIVAPLQLASGQAQEEARRSIGVPQNATLVCRHGGDNTFSIPWARTVVCAVAASNPALHFLFLGTDPLPCAATAPNVHHIPGTYDVDRKVQLLSACDACLHARADGETFGLAVAECSMLGKPVITYGCADPIADAHLRIQGQYALLYTDEASLFSRLEGLTAYLPTIRSHTGVYSRLYDRYASERVMLDFVVHFKLVEDLLGMSKGMM